MRRGLLKLTTAIALGLCAVTLVVAIAAVRDRDNGPSPADTPAYSNAQERQAVLINTMLEAAKNRK